MHDSTRSAWAYIKPWVDAILIFVAFAVAYWVRYELQWIRQVEPVFHVPLTVYIPYILLLTSILLTAYWLEGAYRQEKGRLWFDEFYIVARGTLIGVAAMMVIVFVARRGFYSRLIFLFCSLLI